MSEAPERIWANAQEWPKGTGRIEVYAAAKPDPDDPANEYIRLDLHDAEVARLTAERDRFEAALGRACLVGGTTYLIERATKAEADLAALRKAADALAEFADHDATCERLGGMGVAACICGYDAALAAYRATKGGAV